MIAAPPLIGAGSFGPYCVRRLVASCEDSPVGAGDVTHGCSRSVSEAGLIEIQGNPTRVQSLSHSRMPASAIYFFGGSRTAIAATIRGQEESIRAANSC